MLYHYTCDHGRKGIGLSGFIEPVDGLVGPLVWLTDMVQPDRHALGLTSHMLACDRLAYRYELPHGLEVEHWPTSLVRARAPELAVMMLESVAGVDPRRWFVTRRRQFGTLDRRYINAAPVTAGLRVEYSHRR